jgi:GNAT superfamily N-acetyltransferase
MMINNYLLIDYTESYKQETIDFIDAGYKSVAYSGLELDSLDNDLIEITENYKQPSCFKLLLDNNKIIGTCAVKIDIETLESELKRVFIDPKYRGQGLGKKISEWAFRYAIDQGAESMDIWSGTYCRVAHKLYEKLGAKYMGVMRNIGGVDNCYEKYFKKNLRKITHSSAG